MELREYLNVIRARKWTILQAVVIVTLTAMAVSLLQPPTYRGETKLLIADRDTGAAIFGTAIGELSNAPERGLQTQVQLMQLRPLAEVAIRKLSLRTTPEDLLARVTVSGVGQTNVITIGVTDRDPKRAAATANALGDAYVAWSKQTKRESIKAAADEVQRRLDDAKTEILTLGRKVNAAEKSSELQAELDIATGLYATLADKLEQLRVNEQLESGSGRVVESAAVNVDPIAPQPLRNTALGLAVGLIFGLGMAFLFEYLDNTIKSTDEAEKVYGAPVLGHIPLEKFEKGENRRLTILQHPGSPAAEAYRVLRNSLDFINFQDDVKTLLVTSAAPSEGKSTVAANLAMALAQAGSKVVLLNCDFRRPTTGQFFAVNSAVGLSDVLLGRNSLKAALQRPMDLGLLVLTAGRMPPNPSELLGSGKMIELIDSLKEWCDWIIVDSPPLLAVADAAAASRWADGILLVTRGGVSTRDAAKSGREMLHKVGARILGVVVWGLEEASGGRGYGYSYRYGGYYSDESRSTGEDTGRQRGFVSDTSDAARSASRRNTGHKPSAPDGSSADSVRAGASSIVQRLLAATLAFVGTAVVLSLLLYWLDSWLGWGLIARAIQLLGG